MNYNNYTGRDDQGELVEIPLERIISERKVFYQVDELVRSIQADGLRRPILVREQHTPGTDLPIYIIIAGEKRYQAVTWLGWDSVECIVVRQGDYIRWMDRLAGVR